MANSFFQRNQKFLPYETSLIVKANKASPEIIKSGTEKDVLTSRGASRGTLLEIIPMHIKNPPRITFMAFLGEFTDSFSPEFESPKIYGRSDSYHVWKASPRSIGLSWTIPSSGKNMALRNLANINWFMASLYPAYKEVSAGTNAVSASPLFRVKYSNMIMSADLSERGLLCTITGVKLSHNKKAGFIPFSPGGQGELYDEPDGPVKPFEPGGVVADLPALGIASGENDSALYEELIGPGPRAANFLIPVEYKIGCTLNIIHEHPLGWNHETGKWRSQSENDEFKTSLFPYGIQLNKGLEETPPGDGTPANSEDPSERHCDHNGDGVKGDCEPDGAALRETTDLTRDYNGDGRADYKYVER